jgi:ABC-2 type transport system ATP-binding protein
MTCSARRRRRGAAVLYSTHYMEEAEYLCDRVVLIDHGRVIATGTPADLIKQSSDRIRLEIITRAVLPAGWLDAVPGAQPLAAGTARAASGARGNRVEVAVDHLTTTPLLLEQAAALGGEVLEFHVHQPDLHDVFIKLTGTGLRD